MECRAQRDAGRRVDGDHGDIADTLFGDELVHHADTQALLHHGHGGKVLDGGIADVGINVIACKQRLHVVITAQGGHDEAVLLAPLQRVAVGTGQRMIPRQQGQHGVLGQWDPLEGHILLIAEEADVSGALLQPLGHLLPDTLHQLDLHVGVVLLKIPDDSGQPMGGDAGIGGDGDGADQQAVHLGGQLEKLILLVKYGVNASVPKTLVRHLVQYYADTCEDQELKEVLLDVLDTPVSPELLPPKDGEIAQKTEDLVGPYELHDFYLYYVLRFGFEPSKIYRLAKLAFEGTYDSETIMKWLKTFYRRFFAQQFKRSCLPDGPKIGTVALSPRGDWRMPSDACAAVWMQDLEALKK